MEGRAARGPGAAGALQLQIIPSKVPHKHLGMYVAHTTTACMSFQYIVYIVYIVILVERSHPPNLPKLVAIADAPPPPIPTSTYLPRPS